MKSFAAIRVVLALGLLFLAGCATDLRISGVGIAPVSLKPISADRAELIVRYVNESVVPIAVSSAKHRLYLNGDYIGRSLSEDAIGLPRMNTASQTVTISLENAALLERLQALSPDAAISYRLESVLHVEAGQAYDNVKLKSSGELNAGEFLGAR